MIDEYQEKDLETVDYIKVNLINQSNQFMGRKLLPEFHDEIIRFASPDYSIEKYIKYYLNLYNTLNGKFKAVGDFSNTNRELSIEFLDRFAPMLKKHFNVKVLMIFRDPIRANFSKVNYMKYHNRHWLTDADKKKNEDHYKGRDLVQESISTLPKVKKYAEFYKKFSNYFECKHVVMEELWEGNTEAELESLSNFLDYKLTKENLHFNVFSPDRGVRPIKHSCLEDQWDSDHEVLTPEIYERHMNDISIQKVYADYVKTFGRLPLYWGKPIDYEYNQSLSGFSG